MPEVLGRRFQHGEVAAPGEGPRGGQTHLGDIPHEPHPRQPHAVPLCGTLTQAVQLGSTEKQSCFVCPWILTQCLRLHAPVRGKRGIRRGRM